MRIDFIRTFDMFITTFDSLLDLTSRASHDNIMIGIFDQTQRYCALRNMLLLTQRKV